MISFQPGLNAGANGGHRIGGRPFELYHNDAGIVATAMLICRIKQKSHCFLGRTWDTIRQISRSETWALKPSEHKSTMSPCSSGRADNNQHEPGRVLSERSRDDVSLRMVASSVGFNKPRRICSCTHE